MRDVVLQLLEETTSQLNQLGIVARTRNDPDAVLLALLSKSIILSRAVVTLAEAGFGDEAFGLCRTSVEISFIIRYLTNKDTHARCRRYTNYFARTVTDWQKIGSKYYPERSNGPRIDQPHIDALAAAYPDQHKWTDGKTVRAFAEEDDVHESDSFGKPLKDLYMYDVIYRNMSYYVHGTVQFIPGAYVGLPGEPFWVPENPPPTDNDIHAIGTTAYCVSLNVKRIFRFLNLSVPVELLRMQDDFFAGG